MKCYLSMNANRQFRMSHDVWKKTKKIILGPCMYFLWSDAEYFHYLEYYHIILLLPVDFDFIKIR